MFDENLLSRFKVMRLASESEASFALLDKNKTFIYCNLFELFYIL